MNLKHFLAVTPISLILLNTVPANAGMRPGETGALVCVTDKWDEKEPEKGHKLADAVMRCVVVPDDAALPKYAQDCNGKYEYMPDGSWKGSGTCTNIFKDGDKSYESYEEGSHLKDYKVKVSGGTGKYKDAKASGTYMYEGVTDTLFGGRYRGD